MSPRSCDGDGTLGGLLALHVSVVDGVAAVFAERVFPAENRRRDREFSAEEPDRFGQAADRDDIEFLDDGGFAGVLGGDEQPLTAFAPGLQGHGQRPLDWADIAIQGQFADDRVFGETLRTHLPAGRQHADRDGEVRRRGLFR